MNRRELLQLLTAAPVAALTWTDAEAAQAHEHAQAARQTAAKTGVAYKPKFFTAHEWTTVRTLADIILPRDERSGSATDAGVPEFMDFMMIDQPVRQTAMRGGLAWLDLECQDRFDKTFVDCRAEQRTAVLDDISWPQRAQPAMMHGVDFFNNFRNLTSTGFWTTKTGMADLQYMGNTFVAEWKGCPDEVLKKLGVSAGD
ncbi:MAG: transcriptional initiation protein Tat [Acidobacteria bacterium]|nr:MAG: transcriptional initiation protein Tat [Acidobacteriota bacterium]